MGLQILRKEGLLGFTKGMDAGLARQFIYGGAKRGVYDFLKSYAGGGTSPL